MDINALVRSYQASPNNKTFNAIYDFCYPEFRYWYRHAQRHVRMDRQTLLSEFQYVVMKVVRRYNSFTEGQDAFLRYFRAAAKKHAITLRRQASDDLKCHSLQQDWEIVDPKSYDGSAYVEVMDVVGACLDGDEKVVVLLRLAGEAGDGVRRRAGISEFRYRQAVRNIKANRRLSKAVSRE